MKVGNLFRDIYNSKSLIYELTKNDFKSRYLGSYLGIMWAFIQPFIQILIYWFVFQVGFKTTPVGNFPFLLWLIAGIVPWFFFSEAISNTTYSIQQNSYLVKKIAFKISILPIIKIISSLYIHIFFVIVLFVLFQLYGYGFSIYNLQIFYYLFALIFLMTGLSYITSSLIIFFRDMGQIVTTILQFGFWITPIFWSFDMIPEKYQFLFKINPLYYIVSGYRDTFVYHRWFWNDEVLFSYFWLVSIAIFIVGVYIFKKLKPHFADVI